MDKQVLGLVLNWLGNTASSEDIVLVKQVIDVREGKAEKKYPDYIREEQYPALDYMGLHLTSKLRELLHKGEGHTVFHYFTHIQNKDGLFTRVVLRKYISEYVST